MKVIEVAPDDLVLSDDMRRSGRAKQFEDRLRSSIDEIGLAEPIKIAPLPSGKYLVVDGIMRLRALTTIRESDASRFAKVPAYLVDYDRRYEIRFQTDIYQDLLPSQLATLVEHLHAAESVRKADIARYIGVAPTTLRNYTGLHRLIKRGGLFARVVDLMDVGVIPHSNPFAWLRLTDEGVRLVLEQSFSEGEPVEQWIEERVLAARQGPFVRYTTTLVETFTGSLPPTYYREDEDLRNVKRDLGLRRAAGQLPAESRTSTEGETSTEPPAVERLKPISAHDLITAETVQEPHPVGRPTSPTSRQKRTNVTAIRHVNRVSRESKDPVLQTAARALRMYLQ